MKNKTKITLIILMLFVLLISIFFVIDFAKPKMRAVVVKVDERGLLVMEAENTNELISLGFTKEGNIGFKQGQEILIYFDGMVMESYPAQLGHVEKIKIVKEKSNKQISDDILRYAYSLYKNVSVSIKKFTAKGISFNLTDTNELPYVYSNNYKINTKVKNEEYTGVGQMIGENTGNSTAGFTGTGLEYIWQEVDKISNISSESTIEILQSDVSSTTSRKIDWTKMYGELKSGEYEFVFSTDGSSYPIRINFTINENGEILYSQPTFN